MSNLIKRRAMMVEQLADRGYDSLIDIQGNIQFHYKNRIYVIEIDSDCESCFRILTSPLFKNLGAEAKASVLAACTLTADESWCAKFFLIPGGVGAAVDEHYDDINTFGHVFERALETLKLGVILFSTNLEHILKENKDRFFEADEGESDY